MSLFIILIKIRLFICNKIKDVFGFQIFDLVKILSLSVFPKMECSMKCHKAPENIMPFV